MTSTKRAPFGALFRPGGRDISGYLQWAGWTLGDADSIWSEMGAFKDGPIVIESDKASSWTSPYTWTPSGYRGATMNHQTPDLRFNASAAALGGAGEDPS
jgi:hypothetical protein